LFQYKNITYKAFCQSSVVTECNVRKKCGNKFSNKLSLP